MIYRIISLIRKEFIHIFRDPRSLAIMFILPLVQLTLLGYAATTDIEHLSTVVLDADKSPQSRQLIAAYAASNYFTIIDYVDTEEAIRYQIDRGDARAGFIIPGGYGRDVAAGRQVDVAFFIDGSDPQVAGTVFAASQSVGQSQSVKILQERMGVTPDKLLTIDVRPRVWYNPNMESSHFIIPGLMVLILYLFTALFTASSIVKERETGTIEQIIVTPIQPIELVLAKVVPYIFIAFFDVLEVLAIGVFWFGVPINGSISLLLGLSALFLITALGIGIFISSIAGTQQEALLMTMGTMLPTIFLSGFFFPLEAMPRWLQLLSYIVPARYALEIMRGIILKGVGIEILQEQVYATITFGVVIMTMAATRFRRRLD